MQEETEEPLRLSAYEGFGLIAGAVTAAAALTLLIFAGAAGMGFLLQHSWILWTLFAVGGVLIAFSLRERDRRARAEAEAEAEVVVIGK